MSLGHDGHKLVEKLARYISPRSTVLELGMGPGKDLDLLRQNFQATGSDLSNVFLKRYHKTHPKVKLLKLDAKTLNTKKHFDCIYSNKVLHHLTKDELVISLQKQQILLNPGGIALHTFWHGDDSEDFFGLHFTYYKMNELLDTIPKEFKIREASFYKELIRNDSIVVLMGKNVEWGATPRFKSNQCLSL